MPVAARPTRRPLATAVVVVAAVLGVAFVLSRPGDDPSPTAPATSEYAGVYRSVCTATATAARGDAEAARRIFTNEAHEPLHRLAGAAAKAGDRASAARLLEAKEAVEGTLGAPPSELAGQLDRLAAATAATIEVVEARPAGPCGP